MFGKNKDKRLIKSYKQIVKNIKQFDDLCVRSKYLYNDVNNLFIKYYLRHWSISYKLNGIISAQLRKEQNPYFRSLPSATSAAIITKIKETWTGFVACKKGNLTNPSDYFC